MTPRFFNDSQIYIFNLDLFPGVYDHISDVSLSIANEHLDQHA